MNLSPDRPFMNGKKVDLRVSTKKFLKFYGSRDGINAQVGKNRGGVKVSIGLLNGLT